MTTETPTGETFAALTDRVSYFLQSFKDNGNYKYFERINDMMAKGETSLTIDYRDIFLYDNSLAEDLTNKPDEILDALTKAALVILEQIHNDYAKQIRDKIAIRITNNPLEKLRREINVDLADHLVSIPGIQISSTEKKPHSKKQVFRCSNCNAVSEAVNKGGIIKKPNKCSACGEKDLEMDVPASIFTDAQRIRIQELPEDLPAGELPQVLDANVTDDLVEKSRPGDRVLLTCIVRLVPMDNKVGNKFGLFNFAYDAINIESLNDRHSKLMVTEQDIAWSEEFVKKPNAMELLTSSFAPHIYGEKMMKEATLISTVGGALPEEEDNDNSKDQQKRWDVNVLFIGDPGQAKSEILKFAGKVAPRGIYTSGKGSSAAGLTAAVMRDKDGLATLQAGAVVIGDQGIVCIDEFDKMTPEDRSALHEVMEQQTCSITKAGFNVTLNARVSIIAAANPIFGKYNPYKNITENVNLPVPLLTRFDIILVIKDKYNKDEEEKKLSHIEGTNGFRAAVDIERLSKHILIAKRKHPRFTPEASKLLRDFYLQMRATANDNEEGMITITVREFQGLRRIASAYARLLLKDVIDVKEAQAAINMIDYVMRTVGVDVNTGKTDLGVLYGKPQSVVTKEKLFMEIFKDLSGKENNDVDHKILIEELVKSGKFTDDEARAHIQKFNREGIIFERKSGSWAKS